MNEQPNNTNDQTDPASGTPPSMQPTHMPISELSKPMPLVQGVETSATPQTKPPAAGITPTPAPTPTPQPNAPESNTTDQSADQTDSDSTDANGKPLWRRIVGFLVSWILIPAGLVFIVHNFIFQAWYVDGQSMEPSFQNGNYLIVSKFDVSWNKFTGQSPKINIKRGDVVIFNPPGMSKDIYFIKRAIGLPGERVVIRNGTVTIYNSAHPTGILLTESYIDNITLEGDDDITINEGEVYVLGDNRHPQASQDSRYFGPIPKNRIIGTAALRLLPIYEFGTLDRPEYSESK
jgi:signal peptidase I